MFNPISELEFIEETHLYKVNGRSIPSVSSILKPISNQIYGDIDKAVLARAAERGREIHFAIEVFDETGAEIISEENRGYFNGYKKFRAEYPELVPVVSEYRVYHPALWYAGTLDKIFKNKATGSLVLADFKSSATVERALLTPQLTGYKTACEAHGMAISECCGIHLKASGEYEKIVIEPDFDIFVSLITIKNYIKKFRGD
jgi:hypothetical protein